MVVIPTYYAGAPESHVEAQDTIVRSFFHGVLLLMPDIWSPLASCLGAHLLCSKCELP